MVDAEGPVDGRGLSWDEGPAGTQLAQASAAAFGDPIGAVRDVTGQVLIVHKDGTSEPAATGLPVFANDIVATGPEGAVEVLFLDGTTFSLGENGQMRLDSLIFDPSRNDNGLDATVVKGSFIFITGQVGSAEGEGVSIDTPAGTIGIRGTSGGVAKDPVTGAWIFTLLRDPDGTLSRFTVTNPAGSRLLDQEFETTEVAGRQFAPAQTVLLSPEQATSVFAGALQMLQEQYPNLQPPEQRGELDDIIPEAGGEQYAVDPGVLLAMPEALSELYGLDLALTLADLIEGLLEGTDLAFGPLVGAGSLVPIFVPDSPDQTPLIDSDVSSPNTTHTGVPSGQYVGITVGPNSPILNGDITYSLVDEDSPFAIDPVSGEVTVAVAGIEPGTYTITVRAVDEDGDVVDTAFRITVTPNATPAAPADNYATDEDGTLTVSVADGVLANDSDPDGDPLTAKLETGPEHGTLELNPDGSFSYTPDADFSGADSFTYAADDGFGGTKTGTVNIVVGATPDVPVAQPDSYGTDEDKVLTIVGPGVLENDTDADADVLSAVLVAGPENGTLELNADGSFTYTPDADFNGTDSFTYKANDGTADSDPVSVTVTVGPVNDPPVAQDDSYETAEDKALVIGGPGVLKNDMDVDGDDLSAVLVEGPLHGQLTLNADGSFTYTPDENFNGTDSFTYKANDGTADGNVATVSLTVTAQNDPPAAVDDAYAIAEDGKLVVGAAGVLANDTDVEGDPLSAVLADGPDNGQLTLNADGSFTYTPDADFNGTDTFTYKANDGTADGNIATVTVTVTAENDAPVSGDDAYQVGEDGKLIVAAKAGVLLDDTDVDGDDLAAVLVDGPLHGQLTLNADGSFTYTPDENYNGPDSFSYKANDGTADGNVATVTLTVTAQNDAPVSVDDAYEIAEDGNLVVGTLDGLLDNDTDVENDALTAVLVAGPASGQLTLNPDGSFTYTPNENFNGTDTFTYKANDGTADGNVATVTITVGPQNDAPVATGDTYTIAEDGTLTVAAAGVLANDTDVDGNALSAVLVGGPTNGTLTLNADGSFTYTPDADFNGTDTFTYKANDGAADSGVATVTITVNPQNDPPGATDDTYTIAEDGTLIVAAAGVLVNDTDIDGNSLSAVLVSGPENGTLTLNADGSFTYTPDEDFNGTDTFSYKANDGTADSGVATVTITVDPQNDAPVATGDSYAVAEDGTLTVAAAGVLANDSDVDDDDLSAILVTGPQNGALTLNADGSFTYTPNANFNGTDTFTYKANDGTADSGVATVTITVGPQNDAPVAQADKYSIAEDNTLTVAAKAGVLANDTDIDGDKLTAVLVDGPDHGKLVLNPDGSFVYTPDADFNGADSFTYKASDGGSAGDPVTVTLNVTPVNDPPFAQDDSYDLGQGGSLVVAAKSGVLANDNDIDGATLTVAVSSGPEHGELSLSADGSFTYTSDPAYHGPDSFTYTVSDGLGGTDTATVTMNVADAAPTAVDDVVQTADTARQTIDLVIILDRSGSMEDSPGVAGFSTRLELARAAIAALFEAYESVAALNIQVVDFAGDAASSGWLDSPEEANAYLASLVAGGGTSYTAAIEEAMAAYADAPAADKTEIYFLSDGVPTAGTSLAETGTVAAWESFLGDPANHIDTAFAVGIGAGIAANDPDLADVAFPNGDPANPTVVTDESQLIDTLVGTVANPVSGNVLLNDDFGPDGKGNGGGLLSITVDGVKYTYGANQITNDADLPVIAGATLVVITGLGGTLEFHFDDGDFTYTPPDVDDPQSEEFVYTIVDGDGTEIGATLQIDISDSGVVVLDPHTVIGTDGADSLAGAAGPVDDIISGGKGADSIAGGDRNDHLQGGADSDSLSGGNGIDILIGGAGIDTLDGGAGADVLIGGADADRIIVGTDDRADGGAGNDTFLLLDTVGFAAVQGGDTVVVNLGATGGDVLAFSGGLDLTALSNDRILGIETVSMADSIGGAGIDSLTLGAVDVIDIGAGQLDPNGDLVAAPAVRVNGDEGDVLDLAGGGWTQGPAGGVPQGYTLYLHDSPAAGVTPDAYVLVQTAVTVTTD